MEKYLFLASQDHAKVWICGGPIPIFRASKYRSGTRGGTFTPDETIDHDSPVDLRNFRPFLKIGETGRVHSFNLLNCTVNGKRISDITGARYWREDGLVLSFCHWFSPAAGDKFGGKTACVRVRDVQALKELIDTQLGIEGQMGPCRYTPNHRRNHFLKSLDDIWQIEYRLFWPLHDQDKGIWMQQRNDIGVWVHLPPGIADSVWVLEGRRNAWVADPGNTKATQQPQAVKHEPSLDKTVPAGCSENRHG